MPWFPCPRQAAGGILVDVDGNQLVDLASGIAVTSVGASHPAVVDATIDTVLDGWQEHVREPQVLFQGGPVQLDSALGVVGVVDPALDVDGVQQLFPGVGVVDLDTPADQVMPHLTGVRIFAGYAGWVASQLEGEIRNEITVDGDVATHAKVALERMLAALPK